MKTKNQTRGESDRKGYLGREGKRAKKKKGSSCVWWVKVDHSGLEVNIKFFISSLDKNEKNRLNWRMSGTSDGKGDECSLVLTGKAVILWKTWGGRRDEAGSWSQDTKINELWQKRDKLLKEFRKSEEMWRKQSDEVELSIKPLIWKNSLVCRFSFIQLDSIMVAGKKVDLILFSEFFLI